MKIGKRRKPENTLASTAKNETEQWPVSGVKNGYDRARRNEMAAGVLKAFFIKEKRHVQNGNISCGVAILKKVYRRKTRK
jgi:hypothetical protein